MANKINTIRELREEKEKLRKFGDGQMKEMKSSLKLVKDESKNVLLNKILIPVGTAILLGYGVKKLIDVFKSDEEAMLQDKSAFSGQQNDPPVYHRSESPQVKPKNGLLSNVDWSAAAVKLLPFVITVGKKMYEEGNLPFFEPPSKTE